MRLSDCLGCALLITFSASCLDSIYENHNSNVVAPEVVKDISVSPDLDVLFVIDNSSSTADKQVQFAANFPRFVDALFAFPGGEPNLHIGVVTTTVASGASDIDGMTLANAGCPETNAAYDGLLQNTPAFDGCTAPNNGARYISDISANGTRTTNYGDGTSSASGLADALSCIAQVGEVGCGFEAPLEAMKRALNGSRSENDGFLRPGAALAVIILTDEDDASISDPSIFALPADTNGGVTDFRAQPMFAYQCDQPISGEASSTPGMQQYTNCTVRTDSYLTAPSSYYDFLTTIKDPSQLAIAVIAGDPQYSNANGANVTGAAPNSIYTGPLGNQPLALEPSCATTINGNPEVARPAIRLADFLNSFGDHGLFNTICQSDYSATLTAIGQLMFKPMSSCIEGAIDTTDLDTAMPGLQLNCSVVDIVGINTDAVETTGLPACAMLNATMPVQPTSGACWWVVSDSPDCAELQNDLEVHIARTAEAAAGTVTRVSCSPAAI